MKFTDSGFVEAEVSLAGASLDIRVTDSGAGIPIEAQHHVFERFFQGDGSTTRRKGGAGLGLNIVQSLVHAAGGTVWVESSAGRGTQFRVLIPLRAAQSPAVGISALDAGGGGDQFQIVAPAEILLRGLNGRKSPAAQSSTGDLNPAASVLVGEDHDDNFAIVERHLTNAGYTVDRAANGRVAVDAVTKRPYDLVLMDVEMPEMDGLQATQAIRAVEEREGRQSVPIIALTAHAIKGYRLRCLQAGCTSYLAKPIRKQALLEAVEAALSGR